jgi:hypothetical protein
MIRGLTLDSQLTFTGDDAWHVADGGRVLDRFPFERIRISVSWKAQVLRDSEEARVLDEHRDDLTLAQMLDTFTRDTGVAPPADPLHDPAYVATLSQKYHRAPTVYAWGTTASV